MVPSPEITPLKVSVNGLVATISTVSPTTEPLVMVKHTSQREVPVIVPVPV
jgi:hypothetical protein